MSEHVIAWLFATMLLILLAASGTTHWLIARRGATPTLAHLRRLPSVAAARCFCSGWCRFLPCASFSRWCTAAAVITG